MNNHLSGFFSFFQSAFCNEMFNRLENYFNFKPKFKGNITGIVEARMSFEVA